MTRSYLGLTGLTLFGSLAFASVALAQDAVIVAPDPNPPVVVVPEPDTSSTTVTTDDDSEDCSKTTTTTETDDSSTKTVQKNCD